MGKLKERLLSQAKHEDRKNDAIQCLEIYDALNKINNGKVWSSQWQILVDVKSAGFESDDRIYYPSKIGLIFLKGLKS